MADAPISQLPAKTTPTTSDLLLITDVEDTTQSSNGSSKSLTINNLNTFLNNNLSFLSPSSVATLTNKTYDTAGTGNSFKINGTTISAITGTGSVVLATSPTLVTPTLGVATASSINSLTITTSTGTLTIANLKTLTVNNSLTFAGTDATTMTFPATSDTVVTLGAMQTLTSKTLTAPIIQQNYDGWIQATDTWVYVSASSFKVIGVDRTAIFTKGTRIKLTNNSITVYGVVTASSFSTDTTITLAANSDFSLNNSAITNPFYSYDLSPAGYPGTFTFALTYTSGGGAFTNNPTTNIAKFSIRGNMVTFIINYTYNATSGGSGDTDITGFPVNPTSQAYAVLAQNITLKRINSGQITTGGTFIVNSFDGTSSISNSTNVATHGEYLF